MTNGCVLYNWLQSWENLMGKLGIWDWEILPG